MIKFFKSQFDFRKWLEKNHNKSDEIFVGFYKVASKKKSITYPQALDEAICYGWIDGVRKNIDEISYKIRFTPRKDVSKWSNVNIKHAERLLKAGLMQPAGIKAFKEHKKGNKIEYSYEERIEKLSAEYEKKFKVNKNAWEFFQKQAPYYKRTASFWIMSAKKEETRENRLSILIKDSGNLKRIDLLNPSGKSKKQ
jgi:uncharacterized protein YdeI (YjbR/CyaY-like superfamily)